MDSTNKQIFNLQRFGILQAKLNPQTANTIPNSYAYAWYESLYPGMDESPLHQDLADQFEIKKEVVNDILKYADDEWLKGNVYNFYEYEQHFSARTSDGEIDRHTLISVFKYAFLKGGFDEKFWNKLLEQFRHPSEAQVIRQQFGPDQIYIL